MTTTASENTTQQATSTAYHYVLTLSVATPDGGGLRQVSQDGTFTITDGVGVTRSQLLEHAKQSTYRDHGIAPDAPFSIVFWSLEPNEL